MGNGQWDDIVAWFSDARNYIVCYEYKCSECSNRNGTKATHVIHNWYTMIYPNDFSVCMRSIECKVCNYSVYTEAKQHEFEGDYCKDCGYLNAITKDFTDPLFLAEVRRLVGKPTGDIYPSDVAKITMISIFGKVIHDFKGIEHFINMTYFYYNYNTNVQTKLDLSKNTKLSTVSIMGQNMPVIDLSANHALTYIDVRTSRVSTLYLPENDINLKILYCSGNPINTIDVSRYINLNTLYVDETGITELDVTQNVNLTELHFDRTSIRSIDLSNNLKLHTLMLRNSRLSELDLSVNSKIERMILTGNHFPDISAVILHPNVTWGSEIIFGTQR